MNKPRNPIIIGAAVFAALAIGLIAYVLRPSPAPSGELEAVSIDIATQAATQSVAESATEAETEGESEPAATEEDEVDSSSQSAETLGGIYEIDQSTSSVKFALNEILRGQDKRVIGETNQVAGQILIDASNPVESQLGLIQVNARTLSTDSENRNRALRNEILDVDEFEFITFEALIIEGLPQVIAVGESYTFDILGNLTIRDVVREVQFAAQVTIESDVRISGFASTVLLYADYGLTIPSVPFVASVDEEVELTIDFVAFAQ